ncbi:Isoleucine--tRNA ligase, partial [Bienertia sinuspersici]
IVNEDIDYDELGSGNEDVEVREAREQIQEEKKLETDYVNELECLHRLAVEKGKKVNNDGSDYEDYSSYFDSPPNSDDEDDCGYLLSKLQNKRKPQMSAKGGKKLLGRIDQQCPCVVG